MIKKILFTGLIIAQMVVILFLSIRITQNKKNVLGETSVNTIPKNSIKLSPMNNLKYFYELKPNTVEEFNKDWLPNVPKYTINADSLNERFDYSVENPEKTYRIITLGDSFTFGQNVSTEKNWAELLENQLNKKLSCKDINKFEVINLGVYGYDTQYAVERFRLRGEKYNPDLVIWMFTDFERVLEKTMPYILDHKKEAVLLEKQGIYYKNWKDARENLEKKIGKAGFNNYLKEQLEKFNDLYDKKLLLMALPNNQIYIDTLGVFVSQRANTNFFKPSIKW